MSSNSLNLFSFITRTCSDATCRFRCCFGHFSNSIYLLKFRSISLLPLAINLFVPDLFRFSIFLFASYCRHEGFFFRFHCRLGIIPQIILHCSIGIHRIGCSEGIFSSSATRRPIACGYSLARNRNVPSAFLLSGRVYRCLDVPYNECRLRHSREFYSRMLENHVGHP